MDYLVEKIWTTLDLLRVYTKRRGEVNNKSDKIT